MKRLTLLLSLIIVLLLVRLVAVVAKVLLKRQPVVAIRLNRRLLWRRQNHQLCRPQLLLNRIVEIRLVKILKQSLIRNRTAPVEEVVEQPRTPWLAEDFGYGTQIHGNASVGDPADTMRIVHEQLGLDWVKMQIQWWLIHPDPDVDQWFFYDSVVEEAHKKDLRLMVSIVGAPAWTRADGTENGPPDDYNQYAEFLTELLQRYDGKIDAIEVWNEQNLDREWATANGVNPEDYVTFLKVGQRDD